MTKDSFENEPIEVVEGEKFYKPHVTPFTCKLVTKEVYKYKDKYYLVDWFGIYFIREYFLDEGPLYKTEEEALASNLESSK